MTLKLFTLLPGVFVILLFAGHPPAGAASTEVKAVSRKFGPLSALAVEQGKGRPYVIFLHGYGSSGRQAFQALESGIGRNKAMQRVNWIFPEAPAGGWFRLGALDPQTALPNYGEWQETLKPTRAALGEMVKVAGLKPGKIYWAGFSQGAITAMDYVLHSGERAGGLILQSGIYFESTDWKRHQPHFKGVPFHMIHDKEDKTLPYWGALDAEKILLENGFVGKLESARIGHGIAPEFLAKALEEMEGARGGKPARARKSGGARPGS